MSADGHAVEGAFGFQIGESSLPVGNEVVSTVVGSQGDDPLPGRVAGVGRYISYAALALLFGLFVLNIVSRRLRLSTVGAVGAVSVLVVLLMTGPNTLSGSFADAFDVSLLADTMNTRSGTMMVARILFFVAIAIVGSRMPRRMLGLILVLLAIAVASQHLLGGNVWPLQITRLCFTFQKYASGEGCLHSAKPAPPSPKAAAAAAASLPRATEAGDCSSNRFKRVDKIVTLLNV
jgi:hypothetical protein